MGSQPAQKMILFHTQMDKIRICMWFGVADNLAVNPLLGTERTIEYIYAIFSAGLKLVLQDSKPLKTFTRATKWTQSPVTITDDAEQHYLLPSE